MRKVLAILILFGAVSTAAAVVFYREAKQAERVAARASEAETATRAGLIVAQAVKRQQLHRAWAKGWASRDIRIQIKKIEKVIEGPVQIKEVTRWKTEKVTIDREVLIEVCDQESRHWYIEGVEAKLQSITGNWFVVGQARVMTQTVFSDGTQGEPALFMQAPFRANATEALRDLSMDERLARWRIEARLGWNTARGPEVGGSWYGKRRFGLWVQAGCGNELTRTISEGFSTTSSTRACRYAGGLALSIGRK